MLMCEWKQNYDKNKLSWLTCATAPSNSTVPILDKKQNEFIVATILGLYKYNMNNDKWKKVLQFQDNPLLSAFINHEYTLSMNHCTQKLYLFGKTSTVIIDMKTYKIELSKLNRKNIGGYSVGTIINNECHIIGGTNNSCHLKWCDKKQKYFKIHKFKGIKKGIAYGKLINIQKLNCLLLFCGYDPGAKKTSKGLVPWFNIVQKYSIKKHKWETLKEIKLKNDRNAFGLVLTSDDKYVIICGGIEHVLNESQSTNIIEILDVQKMEFKQCKISCPKQSAFNAIIRTDRFIDDLLGYGFVKSNTELFVPNVIIDLIVTFFAQNDFLHLIDVYKYDHWKIPVSSIIDNMY
eukprot:255504_1